MSLVLGGDVQDGIVCFWCVWIQLVVCVDCVVWPSGVGDVWLSMFRSPDMRTPSCGIVCLYAMFGFNWLCSRFAPILYWQSVRGMAVPDCSNSEHFLCRLRCFPICVFVLLLFAPVTISLPPFFDRTDLNVCEA